MAARLRTIFGNAAIYSAGTLLVQLASFLLLPLYTRVLGPKDYGILSLLWVIQTTLVLFGELALTSAVFRFYHDQQDMVAKDKYLSSSFWIMTVVGALLFVLTTLAAPFVTPLLFDFDEASSLLRLAAATAWLTPISTLLLRTLQLWQRPYVYVLMSILQFVVTMIVTIMLVLFFKLGVIGVLIGQLAGVGVIACSCILILGTRLRYGIDPSLAKLLLRFSIPLVPTGFAALVISLSDRFFLEHYSTLHQLGLYAVADKMTAALSVLVVTPLLLSWNQYAFSNHRSPEFAVVFRRTLRLITVVLGLGILGYSLIIRELLTIATTPEFGAAWTMVPILCAAPVGHALITLFATGIHLSQQTRWIPLLYGSGMVSNLILNAALVPKYGMAGAAWATLVSSLATAGGFYLCARRVYVIDYPIRQMMITLVLAAGCTTLFVLFTQIMASCWLEWVIRILLVMSFGLLLWLFGIIEPNDIPMLTRLWNRLRRHFP